MAQGKPGRPRKESRRRRRGKLGGAGRYKLSTPEIPGFVTRWFNDVGNRILSATTDDDWDKVTSEEIGNQVGELNVTPGNKDLGSYVSRPVGSDEKGNPIYAYLLKKKKEFWLEDRKEKDARIDETEETLRQPKGVTDVQNISVRRS